MQGEIYAAGFYGECVHHGSDVEKLLDEEPEYSVFNGAVGDLAERRPLTAAVGRTVRLYFGVGGPGFTSSFHVIGSPNPQGCLTILGSPRAAIRPIA